MDRLVLLLPAIPLLSGLSMSLLSGIWGRSVVRIDLAMGTLTVALAASLLGLKLAGYQNSFHSVGDSWGSLLFEPLGLLMAFIVALISMIVRIYSIRYMAEEDGYTRFFVLLDLIVAALLVMVTAGDLITLLIAWHLIGVLLYFLLGQDMRSVSAHRYGLWTFITYRFGDLPLLLAVILLYRAYDTWSLPEIFSLMQADPSVKTLFGLPLAEAVAGLVALAAFARSAQFLLHTWLPYTMEGPTPVSALMHAGIVNAGGFLINRFAPVFVHTDGVLHWVFLVGLVTALTGSVLMLSQSDIKKTLGYSTMGQMGFMIMECGVGAFTLAIFHLIAHGLFKGTLFLNAGAVIGEARNHDAVPKDDMYTFVIEKQPQGNRYPWILMAVSSLLVPLAVLALAHWAVAPDVFQKQGAVVLLLFGWVTGAQLLFTAHRMRSQNPWRLVSLIVFSFTVVVIGYTLIGHAFALFLYPEGFIAQLYAAAKINLTAFTVLVTLISAVIFFAGVSAYYASRHSANERGVIARMRISFYALLSAELYVADVFSSVGRALISSSARLNTILRWG
jgi:NADH-quinone oxidoreductase subunit L